MHDRRVEPTGGRVEPLIDTKLERVVVVLSISVRHDAAGDARVRVAGDVDLAAGGLLDHDIETVVEAQQTTSIVVDLAAVVFLER